MREVAIEFDVNLISSMTEKWVTVQRPVRGHLPSDFVGGMVNGYGSFPSPIREAARCRHTVGVAPNAFASEEASKS